jgi:hypothetical protein
MADSVYLNFRPIFLEDFSPNTYTTVGTTTATVFGLGPGVTVTPFVSAPSDTAASSAGVAVGGVYICTGTTPYGLRTRMT